MIPGPYAGGIFALQWHDSLYEAPCREQRGIEIEKVVLISPQATGYQVRFMNLRLVIFGYTENDLKKANLSAIRRAGIGEVGLIFILEP